MIEKQALHIETILLAIIVNLFNQFFSIPCCLIRQDFNIALGFFNYVLLIRKYDFFDTFIIVILFKRSFIIT